MTKDQAIEEAKRTKQYFPYRIHGMYFNGTTWETFNATNKRRQNDLLRKGYEVYLLN